jgi:hypothetical protein
MKLVYLIIAISCSYWLATSSGVQEELAVRTPAHYQGNGQADAYICTAVALGDTKKLVGIIPLAEETVVHHILLYGRSYNNKEL